MATLRDLGVIVVGLYVLVVLGAVAGIDPRQLTIAGLVVGVAGMRWLWGRQDRAATVRRAESAVMSGTQTGPTLAVRWGQAWGRWRVSRRDRRGSAEHRPRSE